MLAIISFVCAFSVTQLSAQKQKEEHKIVIIEKEIDDTGKITETKKILEGEEAKAYMNKMRQEDAKGGTETITIDDSSTLKKIKVRREEDGKVEEMEFDWEGEDIPDEVRELMQKEGLSLDELEGIDSAKRLRIERESDDDIEMNVEQQSQKIKIMTKVNGGAMEEIEFDLDSDEMPVEVKELLRREGIDLETLESVGGSKKIKFIDKDKRVEDFDEEDSGPKKRIKILSSEGNEVKEMEWEGDAIPVDVKELLEKEGIDVKELEGGAGGKMIKVIKSGKAKRSKKAQLGVGIEEHPAGVFVGSVMAESSAMVAGLKKGDVITAVNGIAVRNPAELVKQIKDKQPGEEILVKYTRGGSDFDVSVLLKEALDPSVLRDKTWNQSMNGNVANFKIVFHESLKN